jgi:hypothetical protein
MIAHCPRWAIEMFKEPEAASLFQLYRLRSLEQDLISVGCGTSRALWATWSRAVENGYYKRQLGVRR